jgi:hypothetical protein
LAASLVLVVAFGAAAAVAVVSRSSATDRFVAHAEPLTIDVQQLYTALDDADATAAASYLSGSVINTALRDEYDSDIARAESSLAAASRAVAGDDTASARLAAIAAQIPVYTGLVATAQTDNRQAAQPQPIGTAYLREASTLMRTVLLPDTLSAYRAELVNLDAIKGGATGVPWSLTIFLILALAALGVAQRELARRTHRILNLGLLAATVVLVVAAVWSGVAIAVHRADLDDARSQGAARVEALATAADAVIQAHSDEALMLIAHGSDNGAYAQDFTTQLKAASAALANPVAIGPTTTPPLRDASSRLGQWSTLDAHVRTLVAAGDYQAAVTATVGQGSVHAARIGQDLDAEMTAAQRTFVADADAAESALIGLLAIEITAAVLAAVAAGYGINRRLAEYR